MKFETEKINLDDLPFGRDKIFRAGAATVDPGRIVQDVFGENMSASDMFMYLFRRFGSPSRAGDSFKSGGEYILTTSMEDLYLVASVGCSDYTPVLFGYLTTRDFEDRLREEDDAQVRAWHATFKKWREERGGPEEAFKEGAFVSGMDERKSVFKVYVEEFPDIEDELHKKDGLLCKGAATALLATANDLMRPTNIRDGWFNILGAFSGIKYNEETDTENTKYGPPAKYYEAQPNKL